MIAVAHHPTQAPIQANLLPMSLPNAPTVPSRVDLPMANSTRISGTDHARRNTTQANRKLPPPFVATIRGKRQMLPVPTAMPSMASIIPQRDAKTSERDVKATSGFGDGPAAGVCHVSAQSNQPIEHHLIEGLGVGDQREVSTERDLHVRGIGKQRGDLPLPFDGRVGIRSSGDDQGRLADTLQLWPQVTVPEGVHPKTAQGHRHPNRRRELVVDDPLVTRRRVVDPDAPSTPDFGQPAHQQLGREARGPAGHRDEQGSG